MQLQGVLDQLFCYSGPLGAEVGANGVAVCVWAPTAQQVCLSLASNLRPAVAGQTGFSLVAGVISVIYASHGWQPARDTLAAVAMPQDSPVPTNWTVKVTCRGFKPLLLLACR